MVVLDELWFKSISLRRTPLTFLRLAFGGDEPTPSHYKYRKNFKLSNCAIANFPETRH